MKIFVTGAFGSLGSKLVPFLISQNHNVVSLTRDENNLNKTGFGKVVLGDIRDDIAMVKLTRGCQIIIHAAALKHVDHMETFQEESILTNLDGTRNILDAQEINNIDKVIFVSTDKAVRPINNYGMCKAVSEKLVLKNPNNVVCRYGNVFGSNGSLFKTLLENLKETNTIKLTHEDMTRFFITIEDAAKFVASKLTFTSGLHVPQMKSANIKDMMLDFASFHGFDNPKIEIIGIRPGEKIHEDLIFTNETQLNSFNAERFTHEELRKFY